MFIPDFTTLSTKVTHLRYTSQVVLREIYRLFHECAQMGVKPCILSNEMEEK